MKNKGKIIILTVIIFIFGCLIVMKSYKLVTGIRKVQIPNKESRQLNNMDVNKWMTIKKLSQKIGVSEDYIFKKLLITKEKGDEDIPLKDLMKKYNISDKEIKDVLHSIIGNIDNEEGKTNE